MVQHFAQTSVALSGRLLYSLLSVMSALPYSQFYCYISLRCLDFFWQPPTLQFRAASRIQSGLILFLFFSQSSPYCIFKYPVPENHCFIFFVWISRCFSRKINSICNFILVTLEIILLWFAINFHVSF
jgi:hypothetical protein